MTATRRALVVTVLAEIIRREHELQDGRYPVLMTMHPDTWLDLVADRDLDQADAIRLLDTDRTFRGVPVVADPTKPRGEVEFTWQENPR